MKNTFFLGNFKIGNFDLDKITLSSSIYNNDHEVFLLLFLTIAILALGIILIASRFTVDSMLDSDVDFQARESQKIKPRKPATVIDLTYIVLDPADGTCPKLFVYDKEDRTGARLSYLFSGSGCSPEFKNGIAGLSGFTPRSLNENREAPIVAFPLGLYTFQSQGVPILSNGSPIKKETSIINPSGYRTQTKLFIKENQ